MMMANALTNPDMAALDEHPTHPTTESESKETSTKEDGGSVLPKESNDWEELMGSDLLLKVIRMGFRLFSKFCLLISRNQGSK